MSTKTDPHVTPIGYDTLRHPAIAMAAFHPAIVRIGGAGVADRFLREGADAIPSIMVNAIGEAALKDAIAGWQNRATEYPENKHPNTMIETAIGLITGITAYLVVTEEGFSGVDVNADLAARKAQAAGANRKRAATVHMIAGARPEQVEYVDGSINIPAVYQYAGSLKVRRLLTLMEKRRRTAREASPAPQESSGVPAGSDAPQTDSARPPVVPDQSGDDEDGDDEEPPRIEQPTAPRRRRHRSDPIPVE